MTARLGDLRCLSCGHDPDSVNTVCGCATCHNVFQGSRPSGRAGRVPTDGSLSEVGPARMAPSPGREPSGSPDRPSPSLPSNGGIGRATRTHRFNGWWGLAGVVALSTGWGAAAGWHESWVDLVAGALLTGALIVAGALWPRDGR